eukprot:9480137-Pyramimonas_sp.AAC.1
MTYVKVGTTTHRPALLAAAPPGPIRGGGTKNGIVSAESPAVSRIAYTPGRGEQGLAGFRREVLPPYFDSGPHHPVGLDTDTVELTLSRPYQAISSLSRGFNSPPPILYGRHICPYQTLVHTTQ